MVFSPDGAKFEQGTGLVAWLPQVGVAAVFSLFALMAAAGFGMRTSRAWAFSLGIVLCGLMIPVGNGWAIFGVAGAVFCVFRRVF